ncbi:ethionine resistance protein [Coemansia thaxteri]|nr:ethionine resistance protein [Coemansia thaxteri]
MPLIGSYYLHYLLGFLNLISLGTWGGKAIGAYALGNMTCAILVFAPATGVASALDTLCAASFAHFGSGNEAGLYLQQGLVVVTTWYSAVLVVMQFGISSIYMLLGQQEDLAQPAAEYLRILSLGLWPWMAFECFKRYTQANTQMRLPAMVLAAVVPLHLLNHWFFVWRRGDDAVFTTVAWITVISYWAMFLGLAACTLICEELRPVWRVPALKRLVSAKFLSLALPAMAEACGEYMSFEIMTLIATYLGPTSLAAQAIAFNSMSMVYQLPHGVGGAAAVRIGRLLGQSSGEKAKFLARILVASGLGYGLLGMILFAAFGSRWVALYTRDEEVLARIANLSLMDRTESLTTSYGSRAQYEREKERLVVEINQGMDTVNRNLIQLNQNLESAISLGSNFSRVASLWSEFGAIINPPLEEEGGGSQHDEGDEDDGLSNDDEEYADEAGDDGSEDPGVAYDYEAGGENGPDYELDSPMDEDR